MKPKPLMDKEWLTVAEVATILGISAYRVRLFIKNNWLTRTKVLNNHFYVHRDVVVRLVENAPGGKHGTRE